MHLVITDNSTPACLGVEKRVRNGRIVTGQSGRICYGMVSCKQKTKKKWQYFVSLSEQVLNVTDGLD